MSELNFNDWTVMYVSCTDGITRLGMLQTDFHDINPKDAIVSGLDENEAQAMIQTLATKLDMEPFDNNIHYEN